MKKYKNIYLVGLMGSGKTTLGKILSKKIDKQFYDSDQVIEETLGVDVPIIFEYEGEAGFREREKDILKELVGIQNIVLATGGGIILSKSNRDLLAQNGIVVYLKSNQKDLILRMKNDKTRPLLQNGNIEEISKHYVKNESLFMKRLRTSR